MPITQRRPARVERGPDTRAYGGPNCLISKRDSIDRVFDEQFPNRARFVANTSLRRGSVVCNREKSNLLQFSMVWLSEKFLLKCFKREHKEKTVGLLKVGYINCMLDVFVRGWSER
jgi:hypothetical protein